jgi:tetratricopeptide (TPR) repeat protein
VRVNNLGKAAATSTDERREYLLKKLEEHLDRAKNPKLKDWQKNGEVCAAIGSAYGEFDRFDAAISWYQKASAAEDASVSIKAFEQYANLQVRQAVAMAENTNMGYGLAQKQIMYAIETLDQIDTVSNQVQASEDSATVERECLRGSAYRRLALIRSLGGSSSDDVMEALKKMRNHYKHASDLYLEANHGETHFYPYTNYLVASTILRLYRGRFQGLQQDEKESLEKLKKDADLRDREDPGFWSMVSGTDCSLILSINDVTLPQQTDSIVDGYLTARKRGATPRQFRSVTESIDGLIHLINAETGTQTSRKIRSEINSALVEINQKLYNPK